jgi:hypothetical protein
VGRRATGTAGLRYNRGGRYFGLRLVGRQLGLPVDKSRQILKIAVQRLENH